MAKPKHRMTLEEYYQIINWLKEHRTRIHGSNDTQEEIRKEAEDELGFTVPITSIQKCGKIVKVQWPKSPTPPAPVPIDREAIIILIGALHGLYIETSGTAPEALQNLKSTYVQQQPTDDDGV